MHASTLLTLVSALSSTALALPAPLSPAAHQLTARDALSIPGFDKGALDTGVELLYFPGFSRPAAGEVVKAGGVLTVAWNTTKPYDWTDAQLPKTAEVRLGYLDGESIGYHLDVAAPLGTISYYSGSGSASFDLPSDLATRDTYFITAGSTSVRSAQFTIEAVEEEEAASSSSSSAAPVAFQTTTTTTTVPYTMPSTTTHAAQTTTTITPAAPAVAAASSSSSHTTAPSSSSTTTPASPSSTTSVSTSSSFSAVSALAAASSSSSAVIVAASGNVAAAAATTAATGGASAVGVSSALAVVAGAAVAFFAL
ncbi:hypothetical protein JCM8547_006432 [Rhodosporidiobolus lusitaniae]